MFSLERSPQQPTNVASVLIYLDSKIDAPWQKKRRLYLFSSQDDLPLSKMRPRAIPKFAPTIYQCPNILGNSWIAWVRRPCDSTGKLDANEGGARCFSG